MGGTLVIVGLVVSYLCWVTKREYDYIEKKSVENGSEHLEEKQKYIQEKLKNNKKITITERFTLWNWYARKFVYTGLVYGVYGGFALSIIGFIMLLINK